MKKRVRGRGSLLLLFFSFFLLHGSLLWGMQKVESGCTIQTDFENHLSLLKVVAQVQPAGFMLHFCKLFPNKEGVPKKFLFVRAYAVPYDTDAFVDQINTLEGLVRITQLLYLRQKGMRRCDMKDPYEEYQRKMLMPYLSKVGLTGEMSPSRKNYRYFVLFGGSMPSMAERVRKLAHMLASGVRANEYIGLTGAQKRPGDLKKSLEEGSFPIKEGWKREEVLKKSEIGETAAIRFMLKAFDLMADEAMKELSEDDRNEIEGIMASFHFVETPVRGGKPPNTEDTIIAWVREKKRLKKDFERGPTLAISNQPHAKRQGKVLKRVLSSEAEFDPDSIEVVSPKAKKNGFDVGLALDEAGRLLYEESREDDDI